MSIMLSMFQIPEHSLSVGAEIWFGTSVLKLEADLRACGGVNKQKCSMVHVQANCRRA